MRLAPSTFALALALSACGGAPPRSSVMPTSTAITVRSTPVLDSFITHRDAGEGTPIVLLHGNPTSSRVWRDVIPRLAPNAHCFAPDLIGMGDSGKPASAYRFADHARYLDAWFDALALRDVILVGYDWGGSLAMDWAARHPDRVRGLVVFETFLRPMAWSEWSPRGAELFRALRTAGAGEAMVLESTQFLDRSIANGIAHPITDDERAAWYAPYPTPASRLPILQWPREIPIEGEPADVAAIFARYDAWLAASSTVPKLLLAFDSPAGLQPSPTGSRAMIAWARANVAALEVAELGPAGHHAPEDAAAAIADAITAWRARHRR